MIKKPMKVNQFKRKKKPKGKLRFVVLFLLILLVLFSGYKWLSRPGEGDGGSGRPADQESGMWSFSGEQQPARTAQSGADGRTSENGEGTGSGGPDKAEEQKQAVVAGKPRIVLMAPLSGDLASDGEMLRGGAELAIEEVNRKETVAEFVVFDGVKDPAEALATVRKMVEDPSTVLIVAQLPMALLSEIIPICSAGQVPLVVPDNSHQGMVSQPWVFPLVCSDLTEAGFAVNASRKLAGDKATVAISEPSAYGEILLGGFKEEADKQGMKYTAVTCKVGEPTMTAAISEALAQDPGLVWLAGHPAWGARVATALTEKGFNGRFLAPQTYSEMFLDSLFTKVLDRFYILRPVVVAETGSGNSDMEAFARAFRERFWREPGHLALLGYDTIRWAGKALRESPVSREGLRGYFLRSNNSDHAYKGLAGPVYFDGNGQTRHPIHITTYSQGKFHPVPGT